jgi:raffinose/stachyose/melibiose transport system permease protein
MATQTTSAPSSPQDRRARIRSGVGALRWRQSRTPGGLGWILPAFALSAGLIYFCIGYLGYVSVLPWNWRPRRPETVQGLDSYVRAFNDDLFWTSLRHTLVFFVVAFVVQCVLGIVFAALLHSKVYGGTIFKVLIFLPVVIAPAIMAPVHRRVFAVDGPINWILQHLGLIQVDATGNRDWTAGASWVLEHVGLSEVTPNWIQPATSLWVIIAVQIWSSIGVAFILFFAAMGQIDQEMMEAARLDGAGNVRVLVSIVVPNMRAVIISLAILNAITALKLFDYPYLVTGGGPAHSSEFLGTYIYAQLFGVSSHYGYAAALSILLLVLALMISFIMSVTARERAPRRRVKRVRV